MFVFRVLADVHQLVVDFFLQHFVLQHFVHVVEGNRFVKQRVILDLLLLKSGEVFILCGALQLLCFRVISYGFALYFILQQLNVIRIAVNSIQVFLLGVEPNWNLRQILSVFLQLIQSFTQLLLTQLLQRLPVDVIFYLSHINPRSLRLVVLHLYSRLLQLHQFF